MSCRRFWLDAVISLGVAGFVLLSARVGFEIVLWVNDVIGFPWTWPFWLAFLWCASMVSLPED